MNNLLKVKSFFTTDTTMFDSVRYEEEEMWYHEAEFEGDKHYVDVIEDDGSVGRYFNLDRVHLSE